MKIELDKLYQFELKVNFGDIPVEVINEIYQNGSAASKPLEHQIELWFPELKYVNQKGYDFVHKNGDHYEQKCFTKRGAIYRPSNMIGQGRVFCKESFQKHASELIYVLPDIIDFPKINVLFKKGSELLKDFPDGKISPKKREELFNK